MADSQRKTANLWDKQLERGTLNENASPIGSTYQQCKGDTASQRVRSINAIHTNGVATISFNDTKYNLFVLFFDNDALYTGRYEGWKTGTFTVNSPYIGIVVKPISGSISPDADDFNIMINSGSTPLPYEPYWQHSLRKLGTSTDTLTTLPVDLYADGNSATVGLQGNMTQTGTPTPQSPIQPQETGERTENLLDFEALKTAPSGKLPEQSGTCDHMLTIQCKPNTTYTCISDGTGSETDTPTGTYRSVYFQSATAANTVFNNHPVTITTDVTGLVYVGFYSTRINAEQYLNETAHIWLVEGFDATTPYEPFGYKIPISSANTTTSVYLGEVESTRKIKKLVLTGEENFQEHSSISGLFTLTSITDYLFVNATTTLSTHYNSVSNYGSSYVPNGCLAFFWGSGRTERILYIHDDTYASAADFKTFLQQQYANGTPVTVWYVLATPTIGIVNEPIRKIGDYADTVSGISIPTITGKDTFDVETTLKPSEVSLAYTGWHDASVKEKSRNLFDYQTGTPTAYKYLDENGNEVVVTESAPWYITDYIPIPDGVLSATLSKIGGGAPAMCAYDASKNYITGIKYNTGSAVTKVDITLTSSTPIRFIRFSYFLGSTGYDDLSTKMLNTGSTALPYEPYWQ